MILDRLCEEIYVVREGETLHKINDKKSDHYIGERNPHIHVPDVFFFPGLVIKIIHDPDEFFSLDLLLKLFTQERRARKRKKK